MYKTQETAHLESRGDSSHCPHSDSVSLGLNVLVFISFVLFANM